MAWNKPSTQEFNLILSGIFPPILFTSDLLTDKQKELLDNVKDAVVILSDEFNNDSIGDKDEIIYKWSLLLVYIYKTITKETYDKIINNLSSTIKSQELINKYFI